MKISFQEERGHHAKSRVSREQVYETPRFRLESNESCRVIITACEDLDAEHRGNTVGAPPRSWECRRKDRAGEWIMKWPRTKDIADACDSCEVFSHN